MPEEERILILCVDRDDDVSTKATVETPVVGEKDMHDAASKLILADPEESDANAMFGALKLYKELQAEEMQCEVALVSGSKLGGVKADRKILDELDKVLTRFPADKVILVSDGYADEAVIPIIQSRIPIISIKRIVVRHSARLEESFALFARYLRLLIENPYYSKYALGIPGVLITIFVVLWYLQVLQYAGIVVTFLLGLALTIKGFRIDKMLMKQRKVIRRLMLQPHGQLRVYTLIAGLVIFFIAGYKATAYIIEAYEVIPFPPSSAIIADFIEQAIPLIILGIFIQLTGISIYYYFTRDARFWHIIIGIIFATITYPIALEISYMIRNPAYPIQSLAYWLVIGITVVIVSLLFVRGIRRTKTASSYFRRGGK